MAFNTTIWTQTLTNQTLSIDETDNVLSLSVLCNVGTATINGSLTFKGLASGTITLSAGQGFTISAKNIQSPITGITINVSVGNSVDVILSKN